MKAEVEIVEFEPNDFLRSSDDYWDDDELKDIGEHYSKKMRGSGLWG